MNLYGWDTAFAVDLAVVNQALARSSGTLLVDFDAGADGLPLRATGSFGGWSIVRGGSGPFVNLRLPIVEGRLELTLAEPREVDLSGIALVATVALHLIPAPGESAAQQLRFDVGGAGEVGTPPTEGMITPVRVDDPERRLDDAEAALLMVALTEYVARHADKISFIFATVNLVPPESNSWLAPVRSAFVYADGDEDAGALVILSVTSDRETRDLPRQVDPALLSDHPASFAFSRDLFLQHVMMPSLPAAFGQGTGPGSFAFDSGSGQVVNVQDIAMASVRSGLIDYYPRIQRLRLGVEGRTLTGRYEGGCDLKAGISMTFWVEPGNRIVYDAGAKTLGFEPDPDAPRGHTSDVPWYWWFGGPLVRLIVEIVVRTIAESLAGSFTTNVGQVLSVTRRPPTSIRWEGTEDLQVDAAEVDGDFVMHGRLGVGGGA